MTLADYLAQPHFLHCTTITLVGPFADGNIASSEPIVYVDSGVKFRQDQQGFSVGDGDSSLQQLDEKLLSEKDYSDLSYVLAAIPSHFSEVQLHGFLGGRKDHEILNLGEVHHFLKQRAQPTTVFFDNTIQAFSQGNWEVVIHGLFSCFVIESCQVGIEGACRYHSTKDNTWQALSSFGLSNIGNGLIFIYNKAPLFIFLPTTD